MVDLHTHILPDIDDGSSSIDMSLELLDIERRHQVKTVVLTPHFYPWKDRPEHFFAERERSWQQLYCSLSDEHPGLLLGAEFAWYDGISRSKEVFDFRIKGTDLLLVEMPFVRWTNHTVEEILRLNGKAHMQVVLAHVDRYFKFFTRDMLNRLMEEGVIFQFNAEALFSWYSRMKVLKLIQDLDGFFIGSDCHNLTTRPPRIREAVQMLRHKGGREVMRKLEMTEDYFFQGGDR